MDLVQERAIAEIRAKQKLAQIQKKEMAKVKIELPKTTKEEASQYLVSDKEIPILERQDGEDDATYNARLTEFKLKNQDKIFNYLDTQRQQLRKNLSEITNNNTYIAEIMGKIPDEGIYYFNRYWSKIKKALNDNFTQISKDELITVLDTIIDIILDDTIADKSQALKNLDIESEIEKIAQVVEYNQTPVNKQPETVFYPREPVVPPELKDKINRKGVSKQDIKFSGRRMKLERQALLEKSKYNDETAVRNLQTMFDDVPEYDKRIEEERLFDILDRTVKSKRQSNVIVDDLLNQTINGLTGQTNDLARQENSTSKEDEMRQLVYDMIDKATKKGDSKKNIRDMVADIIDETVANLARQEEGYVNTVPTQEDQTQKQMDEVKDDSQKTPEIQQKSSDAVAKLETDDNGFVDNSAGSSVDELDEQIRNIYSYLGYVDRLKDAKEKITISDFDYNIKQNEIAYYTHTVKTRKQEFIEKYKVEPTKQLLEKLDSSRDTVVEEEKKMRQQAQNKEQENRHIEALKGLLEDIERVTKLKDKTLIESYKSSFENIFNNFVSTYGYDPSNKIFGEEDKPSQSKVSVSLSEKDSMTSKEPYKIEDINQKIHSIRAKDLTQLYLKKKIDDKEFMNVLGKLSDSDKISDERFKNLKYHFTQKDIKEFLAPLILEYKNNLMAKEDLTRAEVDERTKPIFGFGLRKRKFEPLRLGRYLLDKNQLENQNLLHLTHESGNNVKFFKKTYISDDMKELLFYLLKNKKINQSLFKSLEPDEKDLLKRILDKCGLSSQLNISLDSGKYSDVKKQYKDLKEQYLIICSEMEEGNDSPLLEKKYNKIVKELKQVILYMNKAGEMSKVQANHLIASL